MRYGAADMGYRFKPARPLDVEFRRIASELIASARKQLARTDDPHDGIHEARREFKKLRGLPRLARPALGDRYCLENIRWRDAGRRLSSVRDATALIEAFDGLLYRFGPALGSGALSDVRCMLVARRNEIACGETDLGARIAVTFDDLERGEAALATLRLPHHDPAPFAAGFAHVYRRGRRGYRRACRRLTDDGLHDWRKRTKYHWMHLRLMRDIWPAPAQLRTKHAKRLSDLLGDDHDLVVLRQAIEAEPRRFGDDVEVSLLLALVARRQAELREAALHEGERLYRRKPKRIEAGVETVWEAAITAADADGKP